MVLLKLHFPCIGLASNIAVKRSNIKVRMSTMTIIMAMLIDVDRTLLTFKEDIRCSSSLMFLVFRILICYHEPKHLQDGSGSTGRFNPMKHKDV
jgi:hypothetical protein